MAGDTTLGTPFELDENGEKMVAGPARESI